MRGVVPAVVGAVIGVLLFYTGIEVFSATVGLFGPPETPLERFLLSAAGKTLVSIALGAPTGALALLVLQEGS